MIQTVGTRAILEVVKDDAPALLKALQNTLDEIDELESVGSYYPYEILCRAIESGLTGERT
jgi:hypothetical protein